MQTFTNSRRNKIGTLIILQILVMTIFFASYFLGTNSTSTIIDTSGISTKIIEPNYLLEWNVTYGTTNDDFGKGVTVDNDGNIYLVGYFYNQTQSQNDAFIMKYNWTGEELLEITYDYSGKDDRGYGVAVDSSGNIYMTGSTSDGSITGTSKDALIIKYDSSGVKQPSFHIGTIYDDVGYGVKVAGDYVYVTGAQGTSGATNIFVRKFDLSLGTEWSATLGGSLDDEGHALAIDGDGDVYIVGTSFSWGPGGADAIVVKYNDAGTKQWNVTWGYSSLETGMDLVIDATNCYIVGSTSQWYGSSLYTVYMSQFSKADGAHSVTAFWGDADQDYGYGLAVDSAGNRFIAAQTLSYGAGNYDSVIVKYDSPFLSDWNVTWGGSDYDTCEKIAIDSRNNIYVVGSTQSYGAGSFDAYLVKFGIDSDGDGFTIDQEIVAGTNPNDPTDYPGALIPGFPMIYILLAIIMLLGVLHFLNKSNLLAPQKF